MAEDGSGRRPHGPGSEGPLADPAEMPPCHPIKGHLASMTYHRPDSVAYAAPVPGVWFVSPSAAESAGFELAKAHPEPGATEDFEPGGARHPCTAEAVAELLGASPSQPVALAAVMQATGAEPPDIESIFDQWIEHLEDPDEDDDDVLVGASAAGPLQLETDPDPNERQDPARRWRWSGALLALLLVVSVAALIWNNDDGEDDGDEVAERNTTTETTPPAEAEAGSSSPPLATEGSAAPEPVPTATPRPTEGPGAAATPEATTTPEPLSTCSTLLSTLDAKAYDEVALAIDRSGVLESSNAAALTLFAPADDGF